MLKCPDVEVGEDNVASNVLMENTLSSNMDRKVTVCDFIPINL